MGIEVCDTCGKAIGPDEGRYTLADPGPRHWSCHDDKRKSLDHAVKNLNDGLKKADEMLARLRAMRGGIDRTR